METGSSAWAKEAKAVFRKEVVAELRFRHGLTSSIMMALLTVVAIAFATYGQPLAAGHHAGLIWVALLFGSFAALGRGFIQEEETGTADLLRSIVSGTGAFWGKWFYHALLFTVIASVSLPVYYLLLIPVVASPMALVAVFLVGGASLVSALTFCGALVARSSAKGMLLAVSAFPILLPWTIMAIAATKAALLGDNSWTAIQGLIGYSLAQCGAASLLLDRIWSEK